MAMVFSAELAGAFVADLVGNGGDVVFAEFDEPLGGGKP